MSPDEAIPAKTFSGRESASEALLRLRANWRDILDRAEARVERDELRLVGWGLTRLRVQRLTDEEAAGNWYFIGDLHNDYLAWHVLLDRVAQDPDFRLCFLGDLVDRGPHHIECFAAIMEAVERFPDRILWILGNHEDGIGFGSGKGNDEPRYASKVQPAEFVDWLNAGADGVDQSRADRIILLLAEICRRLPRAVLFPDGLLATHGGIPLADRWPTLTSIEAFHHPRVLDDFTWTRAAEAPLRRGWQYAAEKRLRSSDFDYGWRDLEGFAKAVEPVLPVRRVVRGHDHVAHGAEIAKGYEAVPVLTLNAFGFDYLTNDPARYRDTLTLGRAVRDALPEVVRVPVPRDQYDSIYGARSAVQIPGERA